MELIDSYPPALIVAAPATKLQARAIMSNLDGRAWEVFISPILSYSEFNGCQLLPSGNCTEQIARCHARNPARRANGSRLNHSAKIDILIRSDIAIHRLVICRLARNFVDATFPRVYVNRDRYCGFHFNVVATVGGAEFERCARESAAATLARWI